MKYKFNSRTGQMEPVISEDEKIANAVRVDDRINRLTKWEHVNLLRQDLAICMLDGRKYLCVRLNGKWKCCGHIIDNYTINSASYGALIDFHRAWLRGKDIINPKKI